MSVESKLFALLKALVDNRVYPDISPAGTDKPYITYQQVGGAAFSFTEGILPGIKNGRFQVNVWGVSRAAVSALALQAEQAIVESMTIQAQPLGAPSAIYEPDTKLYGSRQDFTVWSDR